MLIFIFFLVSINIISLIVGYPLYNKFHGRLWFANSLFWYLYTVGLTPIVLNVLWSKYFDLTWL